MPKKHKYMIIAGFLCIVLLPQGVKLAWRAKYAPEWRAKHSQERAECQANLEKLAVNLGQNAEDLAGESKGNYPPMSREANKLMFTTEGFLPKYVPAPELLVCPSRVNIGIPKEFDDGSYFYTGYVLAVRGFIPPSGWPFQGDMNYPQVYYPFDDLLPVFSAFYDRQIASAGDFKERFAREGQIDIYRLTEGVRHLYEMTFDCTGDDIPNEVKIDVSLVPVLVEWPDNNHSSEGLGGHVLWLDGQVTWVPYPGRFPMTEEAMAIFTKLAGRPPIG